MPENEKPTLVPKVYLNSNQLDRAYEFVQSQLEKVKPDHDSRAIIWELWDNVYRLIDKTKPTDGGCAVVDPEPQIQVDVMKANFLEALFGNEQNFEYVGTEGGDADQAEIMTAYRRDHVSRIKLREKAERTLHQWLVYGTCICKDPYRVEATKRKVRERVPIRDKDGRPMVTAKGKPRYKTVVEERDFPKWDDTDWQYVSMYDFFPVGRGSDIQEIEGVIHRVSVTWDDLIKNKRETAEVEAGEIVKGVYYNLDDLKPQMKGGKFDLVEYWGRIPKWVITGNDDDRSVTWEGLISCVMDVDTSQDELRRQGHFEKTGEISNEEDGEVFQQGCVRLQENPFWHGERPFRICPYTPVDDEFYGVGMIEPQVEKWHELNTTIRQLVDNKTLQLLSPTIEDANANVQRDVKLIKFPRIKADDVNAVVPLRLNDFSANGWRVIAALKDDMRRASGALESMQGVPMKDERVSATEFQGTFQQAGVRLKARIRLFDENMIKKWLDRAYQNDMQFTSFERVVRVVGKKGVNWVRVAPDDIWGTFDIVTYGPLAFENKVIKVNKLTNFMAIAAKMPEFANLPELLKQIYIAMEIGPAHEASKIVTTQDPDNQDDIQDEITALSMGQRVMAEPNQNHQMHIKMKVEAMGQLIKEGLATEPVYAAFEENVNQHIEYLEQGGNGGTGQLAQNGPEVPLQNADVQPTVNPMEQVRQ